MSEAERYLRDVLRHVPAAFPERRARVAQDVRGHLAESVEAGESEAGAVRRIGPPEQTAAAFLEHDSPPLAPLPDRLGAYLFDQLLIATPLIALLALVGMRDPGRLAALERAATPGAQAAVGLLVVASIAASALYFPLLEARSGQTPGKRLFNLAVVRASGTAVRFGGALVRRLPSFFSFALLDALVALFTSRRQRAFDLVAGTVVVRPPRPTRRVRAWTATAVLAAVAAAASLALISTAPPRADDRADPAAGAPPAPGRPAEG